MQLVFVTLICFAFYKSSKAVEEKTWSKSLMDGQTTGSTSSTKMLTTYVINHEICISCEEDDGEGKDTFEEVPTYAKLKRDPRANLPSAFTICSSVMTTYGKAQTFFNLLGQDRNVWLASLLNVDDKTEFFYWRSAIGTIAPVFPYQWVKSCMAVDAQSGFLQWVVDGTLVENFTVPQIKDTANKPTDLAGKIVLGVWQNSASKRWISRSNQVTNLNIFSTALTIAEMQQNTEGGSCKSEGDYLAWEDMQWELHGEAVTETVDVDQLCLGKPFLNLYPAQFSSVESCHHFCENLGSRPPILVTLQQWTHVQKVLEGLFSYGGRKQLKIWLSLDDKDTEGKWMDYYTRETVNFSLSWAPNEPNGGTNENCAALSLPSLDIIDFSCRKPYGIACMCERTTTPYLRLRGVCSSSDIQDTLFQPMNNVKDFSKLTLVGTRISIRFDNDANIWKLSDAQSNLTGISQASHASFRLGRHNWTIQGDKGCNANGKEYTIELKMTACQKGNFTCDDGQCVSMDKRCDQLPNCRDKSDEKDCKIMILEKSYNKNVPPVVDEDEKVNVGISIDLLKLVDIKEEDYSIEIQFSITLEWKENRATFHNLKHKRTLNALTKEDIDRLWLPKVIYENTDQKETTRLGEYGKGEWETGVIVDREGNFTRSKLDVVDETEIFEGAENRLIMSQTYTHEFHCSYDLKKYPFDTQV